MVNCVCSTYSAQYMYTLRNEPTCLNKEARILFSPVSRAQAAFELVTGGLLWGHSTRRVELPAYLTS